MAELQQGGDDESTASREWIVLTRKIGTGNFSEVRVSDTSGHSKNGNVYNYTVSSLAPDTAYDCCLVPIDTLVEDTMADRTVPGSHAQLLLEQKSYCSVKKKKRRTMSLLCVYIGHIQK